MNVLENIRPTLDFLERNREQLQDNRYFNAYFNFLSLSYADHKGKIEQLMAQADAKDGVVYAHVVNEEDNPIAYNSSHYLQIVDKRIIIDTEFDNADGIICDSFKLDDVKHAILRISGETAELKLFDSQSNTVAKTSFTEQSETQATAQEAKAPTQDK